MSEVTSRVMMFGNNGELFESTSCTSIESENLRFRRMEMKDVGPLLLLFNRTVNFQAYGTTVPKTTDAIERMVERDISRPFYTGYLIESKTTGEILGRGAIGSGYLPKENVDIAGSYKAAPLEEGKSEGPAELQIGDFLVSEPAKLGPTGKSREELYREMILTLVFASKAFAELEELQGEQPVKRVTVTVMNPDSSGFSSVAYDDLVMRKTVIERIFGMPSGVLLPKSIDPRNYSEHPRLVYASDTSGLDELLIRNSYA